MFADGALGNAAQAFIIQRRDYITHQSRCTHAHPAFAARWRAQEFADGACHIHALHAAGHDLGCQEIGAQKTGQCAAKPFLVIRNDSGVRNGYA